MSKKISLRKSLILTAAVFFAVAMLLTGCPETIGPPAVGTLNVNLTLSGDIEGEPYLKSVAFTADTSTIEVTVDTALESIDIELVVELSGASISVNEQELAFGSILTINLVTGLNNIPVVITPETGDSVTYTLMITREEPPALSDAAFITSMVLSSGVLDPAFSTGVFEYTVTVANTIDNIIFGIAESAAAAFKVNGTDETDSAFVDVALSVGENIIEIVVTAEDGVTINTYTLTITKLAVADTVPPVITLAGDNPLQMEVNTAYSEPGFSASDAEEGNLTAGIAVTGDLDTTEVGSYTLNYNVSDTSGNAATTVSRTIVVEDTTSPVITLNGDNPMYIAFEDDFTDPGAIITDNYDDDRQISGTGTVDTGIADDYILIYTATDSEGNPAVEITRTVTVAEPPELAGGVYVYTQHPEILNYINIDITISSYVVYLQSGAMYIERDMTEYDNDADYLIYGWDDGGTYKFQRIGWTETITDVYAIHAYEAFADITSARATANALGAGETWYTDPLLTPPVLQLQGDESVTIPAGESWTDPGALVKDWGITTDVYADVDYGGLDPAAAAEGSYTLTYTYTDVDNNAASELTRTVNVPEAFELPDLYYYWEGSGYMYQSMNGSDFTAVLYDSTQVDSGRYHEYDNDANEALVYGDSEGGKFYHVSWTDPVDSVCDYSYSAGFDDIEGARFAPTNDMTLRCYTSADKVPPVIELTGEASVSVLADTSYTDSGAIAYDWGNPDNYPITVDTDGGFDMAVPETYTFTYTETDADGNSAVAVTREVVVTSSFEFPDLYFYFEGTGYMYQQTVGIDFTTFLYDSIEIDDGYYVESDNDINEGIGFSNVTLKYYKMSWSDPVSNVISFDYSAGYDDVSDARSATADDVMLIGYTDETAVPPVLVLNGAETVSVVNGGTFTDEGATVIDWGTADTTVDASDFGGLDTDVDDTYTITYTATDGTNAAVPITRTVKVGSGTAEIIIQ